MNDKTIKGTDAMNDNDLIKREDVLNAVSALPDMGIEYIGSVVSCSQVLDAINSIPAVSGEAVGEALLCNSDDSITISTFNSDIVPIGTKLYTTPQDQSARIAELEDENKRLNDFVDTLKKLAKNAFENGARNITIPIPHSSAKKYGSEILAKIKDK